MSAKKERSISDAQQVCAESLRRHVFKIVHAKEM